MKKRIGIIAFVTTLVGALAGGVVVLFQNNSSNHSELVQWSNWSMCEPDRCVDKEPIHLYEYRSSAETNSTEYRLHLPTFERDSSLYVSRDSACPLKDEIQNSEECAQIAKDYFGLPGAYRTNNANASKCYYNTNTNGTIHWNPYDIVHNTSDYTSICKKSK